MEVYNLQPLMNKNTHLNEHASSLLDLVLSRNTAHGLTSGVLDLFMPDQIRYHCPVTVLLKFLRPMIKTF